MALNLITDVRGLRVGNAQNSKLASGVTVVMAEQPMVAAASVFGGGPGTRELDAIALDGTVGVVDAIVLSGGSAFGLDAATGVQSYLREQGRGFAVGPVRVPIVPQAVLFDLLNGGDKDWGLHPPYRDLAYQAAQSARSSFELGAAGAGFGSTVAHYEFGRMRGGLGSASQMVAGITQNTFNAVVVGALAAVNAFGAVTIGKTDRFWAASVEEGAEFGGLGLPHPWPSGTSTPVTKRLSASNTTLCIVATDALLSRAQCKRVATMAAAGIARGVVPSFTPLDGDIVFSISTGIKPLSDPILAVAQIGAAAANCLVRAIARGVYLAQGRLPDGTRAYSEAFALDAHDRANDEKDSR